VSLKSFLNRGTKLSDADSAAEMCELVCSRFQYKRRYCI